MNINEFIYLYLLICTLIKIYDMLSLMRIAKEINIDINDTKSFGKLLPTLFKLPLQVPAILILLIYRLMMIFIFKTDYGPIIKEQIEYSLESTEYESVADKKLNAAFVKKMIGMKYK